MKSKKTKKANLESKRMIFFQIGLLISLGVMLAAFEWSSTPDIEISFQSIEDIYLEDEISVITREKEIRLKPPPVPLPKDVLNITNDDDPIENEFFGEDIEAEPWQEIEIDPYEENPEPVEDMPFIIVEDMPMFRGEGLEGFHSWVKKNLKYPEIAAENGISGKVYIQFVVNKNGKVEDAVIVRGADPSLNNEAIRVVMSSPKWSPGKQRGKSVKVLFTIPINFVLQ